MSRASAGRRLFPVAGLLALFAVLAPAVPAAKDPPLRSVQGIVTDQQENPIARAVVQLKNMKTLEVKSYYTDEKGAYHFHGLDPDIEYELKAQAGNATSSVRKITPFDSRREVVINLKLDINK